MGGGLILSSIESLFTSGLFLGMGDLESDIMMSMFLILEIIACLLFLLLVEHQFQTLCNSNRCPCVAR